MSKDYCLSMSGSAVRVHETLETAQIYLEVEDWAEVRRRVISENVYLLNAESSRKRVASELIKRLRTLTDGEIRFLTQAIGSDRAAMLWVSVCRTYPFVHVLSSELLVGRFESGIPTYTEGAYEEFFEREAVRHLRARRAHQGEPQEDAQPDLPDARRVRARGGGRHHHANPPVPRVRPNHRRRAPGGPRPLPGGDAQVRKQYDHISDTRQFIVESLSDDALLGRGGRLLREGKYLFDYIVRSWRK